MYLPHVRGKQFELLALKEYAADLAQSDVAPLIEPVKRLERAGGLQRCLVSLTSAGVRPVVILNPQVGELAGGDPLEVANFLDSIDPDGSGIVGAIAITGDTTTGQVSSWLDGISPERVIWLCHLARNPDVAEMGPVFGQRVASHVVPADSRLRLYKAAFPGSSFVMQSDGFEGQKRNSDYLPVSAYEFSADVLYFREDGYVGFSDYLTIGNSWSEGGFTPRAVAIHWTYQTGPGEPIMIRHFVSTSNNDISNVGRKYLEALEKLVAFLPQSRFETKAGEVFRQSLETASYPGLGIVKKLSMQNHLEVVMKALTD